MWLLSRTRGQVACSVGQEDHSCVVSHSCRMGGPTPRGSCSLCMNTCHQQGSSAVLRLTAGMPCQLLSSVMALATDCPCGTQPRKIRRETVQCWQCSTLSHQRTSIERNFVWISCHPLLLDSWWTLQLKE